MMTLGDVSETPSRVQPAIGGIGVLLISQYSLLRSALHRLLEQLSDVVIIAEASIQQIVAEQILPGANDVVLVDVDSLRADDWELLRQWRDILPPIKMIALAGECQHDGHCRLVEMGAVGIVCKCQSKEVLSQTSPA